MSEKRADAESGGLIRIEAPSYREALREIGDRFGSEYSIVHTRVIRRKGMKGLLGVTGVEVYVTDKSQYAAWREHSGGSSQQTPSVAPGSVPVRPRIPYGAASAAYGAPNTARPASPNATPLPANPAGVLSPDAATAAERKASALASQLGLDPSLMTEAPANASHEVLDKLRELQDHMRVLLQGGQGVQGVQEVAAAPPTASASVALPDATKPRHPIMEPAEEILSHQGFSYEARQELIEELAERRLPGASSDPDELAALARVQLTELIRPKIPPCMPISMDADDPGTSGPRVVMLVGPTGVGKTTTIAKLASPLQLLHGRSVGLVTLDTYRIGAIDQLQRYAEIMGLPLQVVQPGDHLPAALAALQGCDVVFVDTAGRNQRDQEHLRQVRDLFRDVASVETHLCVAMTSSRDTVIDVVENFGALEFNRILITKMDEAPRGGALYDLLRVAHVPLSYLTCGQEVPDDIQAASVDRVLRQLLGD